MNPSKLVWYRLYLDWVNTSVLIDVIMVINPRKIGCISGSLLAGRWSDRQLTRLRNANSGKNCPEVSTTKSE